ncbi:MAG: glycosyltransferase family 1 protein [Gammaproteobacteria bacterium]|nr:MAG: glycosyltransferase family 1 protein [Gammaproteobacteria bacterium]
MNPPAVWFPAVRSESGTDIFTERLCAGLRDRGIRAEITWLPLRAEYLPWSLRPPGPPEWANVAHVNSWLHPRFLPRNLPIVSTLHACVHDPALSPYKRLAQRVYHSAWIKRLEAANLCRAKRITAVSRYTARAAEAAFGLQGIEIIHNGVDTDRFHPTERQAPNRPFRLLYVGNWNARKGVDLLGPVMQALGDDFELAYTADRNGVHEHYPLPPNCRNLGRLSGDILIAAYQQADALIFPSRLEGLPLTVLEAMACGLPVVAADTSSLSEVVEDGATGVLCPLDDQGAFSEAARTLRDNPLVWQQMRQASRLRAVTLFEEGLQIQHFLDLYGALLDSIPGLRHLNS